MLTIAIAGLGGRGRGCYGTFSLKYKDRCKVVAVADPIQSKQEEAANTFGLGNESIFETAAEMLAAPRLADIMVVATPDDDHYQTSMAALKKGYDLLLEKPIAITESECIEIARTAESLGRKVMVCHVLRYSPFFKYMKDMIDDGKIGEVVHTTVIENVGYWHQAHSFVRGNWRNSAECCPMILAKCCHDTDLILWLVGKKVKRVSSNGGLYYFRPEKAPPGAAKRCTDGCKAKENCPYDAEKIYITDPENGVAHGNPGWYVNVPVAPFTPTVENVRKALETGPYGRCVFHCDNDVVDHQVVNMEFEDGATAHLTMTAFSHHSYRYLQIMGTLGVIEGDMRDHIIKLTPFGGETLEIDTQVECAIAGHGGGDIVMFEDLLDYVSGDEKALSLTSIGKSLDSHLVCFAAERSRVSGGGAQEIR